MMECDKVHGASGKQIRQRNKMERCENKNKNMTAEE